MLKRIVSWLAIVVMLAALCSSYGYAVEAQAASVKNTVSRAGGVEEDDGDIDVPFEPTKVVRSIGVEKKPAKLQYLKGEALDLTGMVVRAYYSDNTSSIVTDYQVSGYDPNTVGEQTIRVSRDGKAAIFKVTVLNVGDASGDGFVDGRDATLLLQYAAGWEVEVNAIAADANGDGLVDGRDATLLLQYAAGWDVTLGS